MGRRQLSVAERASLLVAARRELKELEARMDRLHSLMNRGVRSAGPDARVLQARYETLSSAIRWLWEG